MAENLGTHVIAKIVTPDDQDAFATHDANTGEGGFHQVTTEAEMLAITTERRKAGMECRVTGDPTSSKNGKYILQNDLTTWVKENNALVLGNPPDNGWGKGNTTTHPLTGFSTGNSLEEFVDHIATYLDCTAPTPPPLLSDLQLLIPNLYPANKQSEAAHVLHSNVQTEIQPIGTVNGKFGDAKSGSVKALIDTILKGTIPLTAGVIGDDNGTDIALTLFGEEVFNDIYQQIGAAIQSTVPLFLNNIEHTYRLEHNSEFVESNFYIDNPTQPSLINLGLIGEHLGFTRFVSGVPTLSIGDSLKTTFTLINAVSWYYNVLTFGRVESAYTNNADTGLQTGKNNGDNVTFTDFVTSVINGVYTENASVNIKGYNSRALTNQAIPTDVASGTTTGTLGAIRIDTISDETIRLTSGQGQFPLVGGGGAGQAFNSSADLNTAGNEELQLVNGRFVYPSVDYSHNTPIAGPDYSNVPVGTHLGIRWATFDIGNIAGQTSVSFSIAGSVGFNGSPLESGSFALFIKIVGQTGWLDTNAPYPGAGNPSSDGDAALDVGNSTASFKRVTFGIIPRTGKVLVRIGWAASENKKITRIDY